MIFGNLIMEGFGILISNMSQVQTILSFQGFDKIVFRLPTAGNENPDTPKYIRVPPISMNITQTPLDTHQTSPRHPPDIYREQKMPADNNRRHQTKTDSPRHPKTLTSAVCVHLTVSVGVCYPLLISLAPWRCLGGVWGMSSGYLGLSEWYSWNSKVLWCIWGYLGSQSLQYGAITLFCHKRIVCTWDILDIKIPKPPNIRFPKIIGFVQFLIFLVPSENYYNPQSLWITLYHLWGPVLSRNHCRQTFILYIRVYMPFADCTLLRSRGGGAIVLKVHLSRYDRPRFKLHCVQFNMSYILLYFQFFSNLCS